MRPIFTPQARADLRKVARDSIDLFGVLQARRYHDRIQKATLDIAADRRRGRPLADAPPGYLRLSVGAHSLIYRFRGDGRIVIVRILHSRMDLSSHLSTA